LGFYIIDITTVAEGVESADALDLIAGDAQNIAVLLNPWGRTRRPLCYVKTENRPPSSKNATTEQSPCPYAFCLSPFCFLKKVKTEKSNKGIVTKEKEKTTTNANEPASPNLCSNNMGITGKKSASIRLKSAFCFLLSFL